MMIDDLLDQKLVYQQHKFPSKLSPFAIFSRLQPHCQNIFLLESLGRYSNFSRFSYIGFNPSYHITANKLTQATAPISSPPNTYQRLAKILPQIKIGNAAGKNFCGGLVGYFSYEAASLFEPTLSLKKHSQFPVFELGLFLDGLKFDKKTGQLVYFYLDKDRSRFLLDKLNLPLPPYSFSYQFLGCNKSRRQYKQMFQQAKKAIAAGRIFQVVLSLKHKYQVRGNPLAIYQHLRKINPSPHMYYLKFGHRHIIGASPELLIRVHGKQLEHFGTLAGTIRRGKNITEDKKLQQQLQNDEKEKAEHMMLVDLARNDVGKISKFGQVKVKNLLSVKKFSHVQHLFTAVRGKLRPAENSFTALAACFPAGTLSGAPKIEAMKIIDQLEQDPRGPYGGVVGYFSLNGNCMFAINIRSIYVAGQQAYSQVGSGIVQDSRETKEYEEINNKHQAIQQALRQAASNQNLEL